MTKSTFKIGQEVRVKPLKDCKYALKDNYSWSCGSRVVVKNILSTNILVQDENYRQWRVHPVDLIK